VSGYFIGVDLGRERVGIALSDPTGSIAQPYKVIQNCPPEEMAKKIRELLEGKHVEGLVVGLPLDVNGGTGSAAKEVKAQAGSLAEIMGLPLYLEDERYTTLQAEEVLKEFGLNWKQRKGKKDMVAAALILQGFLDRKGWL